MTHKSPDPSWERPPWQVQIRRTRRDDPVGAGVLVTARHVVTCAHVVASGASVERPRGPVYVQFQFVGSTAAIPAAVVEDGWFPELDDGSGDLAVLELPSTAPDGARPAPLRSSAGGVWDHRYRAYGYPKGHANRGVWSHGSIIGAAGDEWLQLQADSALGYALEPGFSGAAVWDETAAAVVAVVITRDRPRGDHGDPRTGYGVPVEVIERYWPTLRRSGGSSSDRTAREGLSDPDPHDKGQLSRSSSSEEQRKQSDTSEVATPHDIPKAVRPLVAALSDADDSVRFAAMSALGDRLSPHLLPIIEPLLHDSDRYIRQLAVDYYGQLS